MLLTPLQAYQVMDRFLFQYYSQNPSEELGMLIGSMTRFENGTFSDPTVWTDWEKALQLTMGRNSRIINDCMAYCAMVSFINMQQAFRDCPSMCRLQQYLNNSNKDESWQQWSRLVNLLNENQ